MAMATPASATKKWTANASGAGATYATNAQSAATAQSQNAIAQAASWLQGVNNAGTTSYVNGLQSAQQSNTYAMRVASVGAARYSDGVSKSAPTFQTQITKVLNVEAGVQLSPKGPKGSQANIQRSTEMQQALRAAKLAGQFQ